MFIKLGNQYLIFKKMLYSLFNKNKKNKQTRSLSYINNYTSDLKKVMKEIEVYEVIFE